MPRLIDPQIDLSAYSWVKEVGTRKHNKGDIILRFTNSLMASHAVITLHSLHHSLNGYWHVQFYDRKVGWLRNRPMKELQAEALSRFKQFGAGFAHTGLSAIEDRRITEAISVGHASVALDMLLESFSRDRDEWSDHEHQLREALGYEGLKGLREAANFMKLLNSKLQHVLHRHGLYPGYDSNFNDYDYSLSGTKLCRVRYIFDEHKEDEEAEKQETLRKKMALYTQIRSTAKGKIIAVCLEKGKLMNLGEGSSTYVYEDNTLMLVYDQARDSGRVCTKESLSEATQALKVCWFERETVKLESLVRKPQAGSQAEPDLAWYHYLTQITQT